jgi:hypothetical protein
MSKAKKKIDLSQRVMKEIRQREVKMRPRAFFVLGSVLLGTGLAGAILSATFFIDLAIFRLRVHDPFGFLWFGQFGLRPFFVTFPWLPFLVAIVGLLGGLVLLRRYEISYKKSFLGLAISLVVLILTTGFLLDFLGFNERVGQMRPLPPFYPGRFVDRDWVMGEISEIKAGEIIIITPQGEELSIVRDEKTFLPPDKKLTVGERIRAVGEWQEGVFIAKGISQGGLNWRIMEEPGKGARNNQSPPRAF